MNKTTKMILIVIGVLIVIFGAFKVYKMKHMGNHMDSHKDKMAMHEKGRKNKDSNKAENQKEKINKETKNTTDMKQIAQAGFDALFKTFSKEEVEKYFAEDYIQHNPNVPTGRAPILGLLDGLSKSGVSVETKRIFVDGDFVIMHNQYNNAKMFGAEKMVSFDIFRIENGKIAEHWDNLTPFVEETVSGRSQTDGPTEITDLDKTEENKKLVESFVNDILLGGKQNFTDYISTETYHQHNPMVADGLDGFGKAVEYLVSQNDMFHYTKVHKIFGEGNFVLTMSEGEWHGKTQAFYDLFRIEDGKIVEHWDVISEIPTEAENENGKF